MFAVIYGLFGGACQNLLAVVIIDLLGLPQLGKAMGLVLLVNAGFVSVCHPIVGRNSGPVISREGLHSSKHSQAKQNAFKIEQYKTAQGANSLLVLLSLFFTCPKCSIRVFTSTIGL